MSTIQSISHEAEDPRATIYTDCSNQQPKLEEKCDLTEIFAKTTLETSEGASISQKEITEWNDEEEEKKVRTIYSQADQGDARAQFTLGWFYLDGKGSIKADPEKGVKLLKLAADQGHSNSQSLLGWICLDGGYGIKADREKAVKWFTKAAEQGHLNAQVLLKSYEKELSPYLTTEQVDTFL